MSNTQNTQEYPKETIRIHIRDNDNKPIEGAKVTLLAMGQKSGQKIPLDDPTDANGEVTFDSTQYLEDINRFEITIEHEDYYTYPINRTRKLLRSYEYGHLCIERFEKIPTFYFDGKNLNIQYANTTKRYPIKAEFEEDEQEYYIKLEDQKKLEIYTNEGCSQKSGYALCLDPEQEQNTESNDKNLSPESEKYQEKLKQDVQAICCQNEKKGNTNCVHRVVVGEKYVEEVSERLSRYFTISDVIKTNQKTTHFSNAQLIELNKKEAMILENYKKLKLLALNCDKIADWIGYKPNVNSGVRVDVVNENLPNSSKKGRSQHTKCEAFDLGFNSKADLKKVYLAIKNNHIPNLNNQVFSQVILEKFSSSKIGWLHIGLKTSTWVRGTEFKISYDGSKYVSFDGTQDMIDKF